MRLPNSVERIGKEIFAAVGLRVRRAGPDNRFEAMGSTLAGLRRRGFVPTVVIDGGANRGWWTDLAAPVFEEARFHLIEPQPACQRALERFSPPRFQVHKVAVTRPGRDSVTMGGVTGDLRDTGAAVIADGEPGNGRLIVSATTLDTLIIPSLASRDRCLLKLDLEGHELEALAGAVDLLRWVEVVIAEVQFYEIERNGAPQFGDVFESLRRHGFVLDDVAMLAARPRDGRLRMGDVVFIGQGSELLADVGWQ